VWDLLLHLRKQDRPGLLQTLRYMACKVFQFASEQASILLAVGSGDATYVDLLAKTVGCSTTICGGFLAITSGNVTTFRTYIDSFAKVLGIGNGILQMLLRHTLRLGDETYDQATDATKALDPEPLANQLGLDNSALLQVIFGLYDQKEVSVITSLYMVQERRNLEFRLDTLARLTAFVGFVTGHTPNAMQNMIDLSTYHLTVGRLVIHLLLTLHGRTSLQQWIASSEKDGDAAIHAMTPLSSLVSLFDQVYRSSGYHGIVLGTAPSSDTVGTHLTYTLLRAMLAPAANPSGVPASPDHPMEVLTHKVGVAMRMLADEAIYGSRTGASWCCDWLNGSTLYRAIADLTVALVQGPQESADLANAPVEALEVIELALMVLYDKVVERREPSNESLPTGFTLEQHRAAVTAAQHALRQPIAAGEGTPGTDDKSRLNMNMLRVLLLPGYPASHDFCSSWGVDEEILGCLLRLASHEVLLGIGGGSLDASLDPLLTKIGIASRSQREIVAACLQIAMGFTPGDLGDKFMKSINANPALYDYLCRLPLALRAASRGLGGNTNIGGSLQRLFGRFCSTIGVEQMADKAMSLSLSASGSRDSLMRLLRMSATPRKFQADELGPSVLCLLPGIADIVLGKQAGSLVYMSRTAELQQIAISMLVVGPFIEARWHWLPLFVRRGIEAGCWVPGQALQKLKLSDRDIM